jgi:hypothetical protein
VRSRFDAWLTAALVATVFASPLQAQRDVLPVPTRDEVRAALDEVRNDPNLAPERKVRMLRWAEPEVPSDEPVWVAWLNALARWFRGLFDWLAESGRYIVWIVGAALAGMLFVYVVRLVRQRGLPRAPARPHAPSHVRDLDIRPESLPDDVGRAALALWERGEQRAALALLYRGLLSRLVHVHGVPVRASSTEGECLVLSRPRLGAASGAYAARLVAVWSAAVYGGTAASPDVVRALCNDFRALDRAAGAPA